MGNKLSPSYKQTVLKSQLDKMLQWVVLLLCVGLSMQAEWVKPDFCRGNDCPRFDVLLTTQGYELREYENALWVSSEGQAMEAGDITSILFRRLFRYIDGANENGQKIAMTSPVLTKVTPGSGPNCENLFRRSFYVPYIHQDGAPSPTEEGVFLEEISLRVYVRSFGGYASEDDYMENIYLLADDIGDQSKFRTDYFITAGYSSPYQPFNRHNEVWLIAV